MEIHFLPLPPNNTSPTPTLSDEVDSWFRHQRHECSCHWISGEEEEPFTIETFAFLLKSHRSSHKDLLLAMVTTLSDQHIDLESNSVANGGGGGGRKEFKSIYQAQALNHVLFRICEEPASLLPNSIHLQSKSFGWNARQTVHRLSHVRNPLNNLFIRGHVLYYRIPWRDGRLPRGSFEEIPLEEPHIILAWPFATDTDFRQSHILRAYFDKQAIAQLYDTGLCMQGPSLPEPSYQPTPLRTFVSATRTPAPTRTLQVPWQTPFVYYRSRSRAYIARNRSLLIILLYFIAVTAVIVFLVIPNQFVALFSGILLLVVFGIILLGTVFC